MVDTLLRGHDSFRRRYVSGARDLLARLASEGQSPSALFVGCSDSRVVPELLTACAPGDIFVVRNIANLVPRLEHADASVGAAIDYAVAVLRVEHIIVCGHTRCGGIKAALNPHDPHVAELPSLAEWLGAIAPSVREAAAAESNPDMGWARAVEENVIEQLANLTTFTVVRRALDEDRLQLHGWVYGIDDGQLRIWDVQTEAFLAPPVLLGAAR